MVKFIITIICLFVFLVGTAQKIPSLSAKTLSELIVSERTDVVVVSFWATFCKPCVAEIPFFISTTKKYSASQVSLLLVSLDLPSAYPKKIRRFARAKQFDTNLAWLNETNADYFCPKVDKGWTGSIPATLVVNNKTGYRKFTEGELSAEAFEQILKDAVKSKSH